ncbi:MAG: uracil-DNA glycosylase [Gemmataceae bacterium]|jgi:DNA polymerase|nr:uracil-DNA glycosylase [Gemmataceae bacterium]
MAEVDPYQQLRARLLSLESAGVGWLPKVQPLTLSSSGSTAKNSAVTGSSATNSSLTNNSPSLFSDAENAPVPESPEGRRIELQLLAERVSACTRCPELASTRTQTVFGVGPIGAELLFVGEAPGADEDAQGIPFVGAAGQLLNKIILACGLQREEIYICNILRCRPPGNRKPSAKEATNCSEYLERSIELVGPRMIVCWGAVAAQNLLKNSKPIGQLRNQWFEYKSIPVRCTYHPAALLEGRSPHLKKDVWEDMKVILTALGKPIPNPKGSAGSSQLPPDKQ